MEKTLKHYHRKKILYNLFMQDSPVSAGVAAFNAFFAAILLKPFALAAVIGFIAVETVSISAIFILLWFVMNVIALAILIAVKRRKKKQISNWRNKEFFLKHWNFIFLFVIIFALTVFKGNYFSIIISFFSGNAFFLFNAEQKKLKKRAAALIIFNIFLISALAFLSFSANDFICNKAIQITGILGRDVSIDGYMQREKTGFQYDCEPLKTLISTYPKNHPDLIYNVLAPQSKAKKDLLEYEKKYPVFCRSAKDFASLPPARYGIGNKIFADKSLYNAELFTGLMRETARYFAWQMQCSPADKKIIAGCNLKLQNLRDCCLNSNSFIYHLTGAAIESMRLQSLTATLQFNDINENEFNTLLGKEPDWQEKFRHSYGDELTHMESLIKYILSSPDASYIFLNRNIPHHLKIYLAINYAAFAEKTKNIINISNGSDTPSEKLKKLKENDKRTGLWLCDMFGPAPDTAYKRFIQMNDMRTMAQCAFKIIDYRRKNGSLPDNLNFLPHILQDSIYGKKFIYEKGVIKLYDTPFDGFILSIDERPEIPYSNTRIIWQNEVCSIGLNQTDKH